MGTVADGLLWSGARGVPGSSWAVTTGPTLCLLETTSQMVPGGMGGAARPPPGPGGQRGGQGEDVIGENEEGTSQGPLHTPRHRGWRWRSGRPFLSPFSETQPFTPEEGPQCPSSQQGQGQRHPCGVRTPQQVSLFEGTSPRTEPNVQRARLQTEGFQTPEPVTPGAQPTLSSSPAPKPTRKDPTAAWAGQAACYLTWRLWSQS